MRPVSFLTLSLTLIQALWAFNPGIVFRVHKKHLTNILKVAIPIANPFLKNIVMDDPIAISILKMLQTNMTIADFGSENVFCPEPTTPDFLHCEVHNAQFHMLSKARIDAAIFKSDGTIHADGNISLVKIKIGFLDFTDKQKGKPYVNLNLDDIEFDKKSLKIHLDFKNIPSFLIDQIIEAFKSILVTKMRDELRKFFNSHGNELINKEVEKKYPLAVPIPLLGITFQTELPVKPVIDDHDVSIGLDGTFFDTASGYNRTKDAHKVEGDALAEFFGDLSVTTYSFNTLFEALHDKPIKLTAGGYDITVTLNGNTEIGINQEGISSRSLAATVRAQKGASFLEASLDINALLWLGIHKNWDFFLDTDIRKFAINSFKLKSNLPVVQHLETLFRYAIELYVKYMHKLSFDIPNVILPFDLKIKDLGFVLIEEVVQLGVTVEIDHLVEVVDRAVKSYLAQKLPQAELC